MQHVPYTYLIGWQNHDLWYYGVRYAKECNPNDLWISYFTSSSYVQRIRENIGEPDVIQIRKIFNNAELALIWEKKVLRRMCVLTENKWVNKHIGGTECITFLSHPGPQNGMYGKTHTPKARKALSNYRTGKTYEELYNKKIAQRLRKEATNRRLGKTYEELFGEEKAKALKQAKSIMFRGKNNPSYGKSHSLETIKLIKEKTQGIKKPVVKCIHCGKLGGKPAMIRHHFDNCKLIEI